MSCYLYSQENRPTDMTGFRLYYNLNKHATDQDSNLGRINLVGRCSQWAPDPGEYLWYHHYDLVIYAAKLP
jgi:hypothetical protein